jgi:hypothetical protein
VQSFNWECASWSPAFISQAVDNAWYYDEGKIDIGGFISAQAEIRVTPEPRPAKAWMGGRAV